MRSWRNVFSEGIESSHETTSCQNDVRMKVRYRVRKSIEKVTGSACRLLDLLHTSKLLRQSTTDFGDNMLARTSMMVTRRCEEPQTRPSDKAIVRLIGCSCMATVTCESHAHGQSYVSGTSKKGISVLNHGSGVARCSKNPRNPGKFDESQHAVLNINHLVPRCFNCIRAHRENPRQQPLYDMFDITSVVMAMIVI